MTYRRRCRYTTDEAEKQTGNRTFINEETKAHRFNLIHLIEEANKVKPA
jgi:hypothetical protein